MTQTISSHHPDGSPRCVITHVNYQKYPSRGARISLEITATPYVDEAHDAALEAFYNELYKAAGNRGFILIAHAIDMPQPKPKPQEQPPMSSQAVTEALAVMNAQEAGHAVNDENEYQSAAARAWRALGSGQQEVLKQLLFQGPVWDGNIISKRACNYLIEWKLATHCCFMGKQGYTTATIRAFTIFRAGRGTPIATKPGLLG
jgi:hypothetical protein